MGTRSRWIALASGVAVVAAMLATPPVVADQPVGPVAGLGPDSIEVMNRAPYRNAQWAVSVTDATTGERLVDHNADVLLGPASVTKTYSAAAAWTQFGPASRIVTPVVRTGPVRSGVLRGDLVLVARGDMTLGGQTGADGRVVFADIDHNDANALRTATLPGNRPLAGIRDLARQVRSAGIRRIAGQVIIDDRLFRTVELGDDGPVSPIVLNNNLIDVVVRPTRVGEPARVRLRPDLAPWRVSNRTTTTARGRTDVTVTGTERGLLTVTGHIPVDSGPVLRVWHVTDPATFARTAFIRELRRAGVAVTVDPVRSNPLGRLATTPAAHRLPKVARLRSLPLSEHVRYVLKVSYNRGAQTLVCLLAVAAGSRDCDAGFPVMGDQLADLGVDPTQVALSDGSGRPGNLVTARSATDLMEAFARRDDLAQWRETLPVLGRDGSLADVQRSSPAAGHVFAKTGTNASGDFVNGRIRLETKTLSGYIQARSGRWLAMAIIVNEGVFDDLAGLTAANQDLGEIAADIWATY